jgi:predicted CXXCH cytochrome family protein
METKWLLRILVLLLLAGCESHRSMRPLPLKTDKDVTQPMPKSFDINDKNVFQRVSCNDCHEKLEHKFIHKAAKISCLSCHVGHKSKKDTENKLKMNMGKMCLQCHKSEDVHQAQLSIRNHPLTEKVNCLDCHDPHSSNNKGLIKFDFGKQTPFQENMCAYCHWSKSNDDKYPR